MEQNKVSIIMSIYNEPEYMIKQALESLVNQTYKNIEIIVILDNPNNHSAIQLMNKYKDTDSRIRFFINDKNMGLAQTLNKGIDLSTGIYIARMDADDICMLNRIQRQVDFLNSNNNIDFVSASATLIDEDGLEEKNIKNVYKGCCNPRKVRTILKFGNFLCHPLWMVRRKVFDTIKYTNIRYGEDYDFILQCIENKFKIVVLKDVLLKCRIRKDGMTFGEKKCINQMLILYIQRMHKKNMKIDYKYIDSIFEMKNKDMINFSNAINIQYSAKNKYAQDNRIKYYMEVLKSVFKSRYQFRRLFNAVALHILLLKE